jgi:hypothetical protein
MAKAFTIKKVDSYKVVETSSSLFVELTYDDGSMIIMRKGDLSNRISKLKNREYFEEVDKLQKILDEIYK